MSRIYKTEAIIIKRKNYSEADKILTIFTKHYGKLAVLAKGIRKITSRRSPHLELFHRCYITLHRGKTWDIVTEAENIETYASLRLQLDRLVFAYKAAEVIDQVCPEKQTHSEIYTNFAGTLGELNSERYDKLNTVTDSFMLQTLKSLGFLPEGNLLSHERIGQFYENLMERRFRSDAFLTRIASHPYN